MTYTEAELMDEMQDVTKYEFMVLRHLAVHGPKFKTYIMQDLIREFPDEIEHGEYLIPGKEYSDDIDEAVEQLCHDGAIYSTDGRGLNLTQYGMDLYYAILNHPEVEIDEDLADLIERLGEEARRRLRPRAYRRKDPCPSYRRSTG